MHVQRDRQQGFGCWLHGWQNNEMSLLVVNGDEIFMTRWETSKRNTQLMLTLKKKGQEKMAYTHCYTNKEMRS